MIIKNYEIKEHTVTEKVCTDAHLLCDVCGKEITNHYWRLTTFHNDWVFEPYDSNEYFDLCSPECIQDKFNEYKNESNNSCNTMEFQMEHIKSVNTEDLYR